MRKLLRKCMTASLAFAIAVSGCFSSTMPAFAAETGEIVNNTVENEVLRDFDKEVLYNYVSDGNGGHYDQLNLTYNGGTKIYESYDAAVNDLALCLRKIYKNRYDNDRRVKVYIPIQFQSEEIDNFITEQGDCFAQDVYSKMVEVTNDPDEGEALYAENAFLGEGFIKKLKYSNGSYSGTFIFDADRCHSKEEYEAFQTKAKEVLDSLNLQNKSDIQKLYELFRWIAPNQGNVKYCPTGTVIGDKVVTNCTKAYSALMEGGATCGGFSDLYEYFAISLGIETYVATVEYVQTDPISNTTTMVGHAMVITRLDDKYYYIDPSNLFTDERFLTGNQEDVTLTGIRCVNKTKEQELIDSISLDRYPLTYINCTHETTEIKNATSATFTSDGYTGDEYCKICNRKINNGTKIRKKEFDVSLNSASFAYTGSEITPAPIVSLDGKTLTQETDYTVSYKDNVNAGTATITITGMGEYNGGVTEKTFTITPKDISDKNVVYNTTAEFTGNAIEPVVEMEGLTAGTDYTVTYANNINTGTGSILIRGIGNYSGEINKTFEITAASIKDKVISIEKESYEYTGSEICPEVTIEGLIKDTDYSVSFSNNKEIGTATITVTGKGNYTGTASKNFAITKKAVSGLTVTLDKTSYEYTGSAITPVVTVKDKDDNLLTLNADYTVTYSNNTNAGTATVTVEGTGIYKGSVPVNFTITRKSIKDMILQYDNSFTYTGSEICPDVTIDGLTKGKDFEVSYENNINVGTNASIKVSGTGNYTGALTGSFEIKKIDISKKKVTVLENSFVYTGNEVKPEIQVEGLSSDNYTVKYSDNINAGTATVTVNGKGNYTGTTSAVFTISPKDINEADTTLSFTKGTVYEHTGNAIEPEIKVGGLTSSDYAISYQDNINIGEATAIISGKGNYTGKIEKKFNIVEKKISINDFEISIPKTSYEYTGTEIVPEVTVKDGSGTVLTKDTDYTVSYINNTEIGTATITVQGTNLYEGSRTVTFGISQADISKKQASLSQTTFTYTGNAIKPTVTIAGLTEGTDYKLTYHNNTHATDVAVDGTAFVRIIGQGNYTGDQVLYFTIDPKPLTVANIKLSGSYVYTGEEIKPKVSLVNTGDAACEAPQVEYIDNINSGTGKVKITVEGDIAGTVTKEFTITPADISNRYVSLSQDNFIYTGNECKPVAAITGLSEGIDFTVSYKNNINPGKGEIIITGMGNYTGSVMKYFTITKPSDQAQSTSTQPGTVTKPTAPVAEKKTVTSLTITGISHNISAGKKIKLTAESNLGNVPVTWSSSNPKVATVSQSGIVTMSKKSAGKSVIITATYANGTKASFPIKSMKGVVKKVTITGSKTVKAGKSIKLKAKVSASAGANKKIKWISSNTSYAVVSSSGKVTALKSAKGKSVKITAMATDGSNKKKTATIKIK